MAEFLPGTQIPTTVLDGDQEEDYVERMVRILRTARLNAHYPDARAMLAHVAAMSPRTHQGLYPGLECDLRTGLPSYKEWTRIQTDVRLAPNQIRQLGDRDLLARKAAANPDSVHGKQLKKYDYYSAIAETALVPLGDMQVKLRRIDEARSMAHFHVILDKLDASGVFVRYAIDVAQRRGSLSQIVDVDQREVARQTEDFQALVYRFTSLDAEFTFVKLASMGGLEVERVIKGVVGPVYFPWTRTPEALQPFVAEHGFLATFGLDMAAIDVAESKANDPFDGWTQKKLTAEGLEGYKQARTKLGYKVFKDRKFVCARPAMNALRALCTELGTRNIVYGV